MRDGTPLKQSFELRTLAVQTCVGFVILTVLICSGIYLRTQQLMLASLHDQAVSYAGLVVAMRSWNAAQAKGVWVAKGHGVETNPYLRSLGIVADISSSEGTLTLRNPAVMTHEVSEILDREKGVYFRLTSLKLVNPDNAPDAWERTNLRAFERQADSSAVTVDSNSRDRRYRYMRPLSVEASCLRCHAKQNYAVGEVRGAISVSIPMRNADASQAQNAWILAFLGFTSVVVLSGGMLVLIGRTGRRIGEAEAQLRHAAITDELTGLPNRRQVFERLRAEAKRSERSGAEYGLVMIDIDHFKNVNDTFGHAAGDAVLRELGRRMSEAVREYDVIGRVGGEEFLVIAPETGEVGLVQLAERIRAAVDSGPVDTSAGDVAPTISLGATTCAGAADIDAAVAAADKALYEAKRNGRDRVEFRAMAEEPG
jgi:diguanylate cyclase (GGDEF)-like protein